MRAKKQKPENGKRKTEVKHKKINGEKNGSQDSAVLLHASSDVTIYGNIKGQRVPSRILEEQVQQSVKDGARDIHIICRWTTRHRGQDMAERRDGKDYR